MQLPVRIQTEPGTEPVLSVDGAFGAPGLNLSHWPGNATPAALKHDLSTGIALAFARLDAAERGRLAAGCTALVNNHYDTDGLCAMLAVLEPAWALAHARALLDAAWCGDFFRFPSREAFAVDCVVSTFADPERSPIGPELRGLEDRARHERATHAMLERMSGLLVGDLEPHRDLWEVPLARLEADVRELKGCAFDDLVHLDFAVWTAPAAPASTGPFDPGRHALFGASTADRLLVIAPGRRGATFRLLIGTASFFDLVSRRVQPRPDLAALAAALNELEGSAPTDDVAWRHQPQEGASPELWFGAACEELYVEHARAHLRSSALDPLRVKREVVDALRATWTFPETGAGPELDWARA